MKVDKHERLRRAEGGEEAMVLVGRVRTGTGVNFETRPATWIP